MPLPERAKRIAMVAAGAFTAKTDLDSWWQDTAEIHFPEHADFTDIRMADDFESFIYDGTPTRNRRDFGNWLGAVLRPKGRVWAKHRCRVRKVNKLAPVRTWLEDKDETLRDLAYEHDSGFISAMSLRDHQYVTFGNAVTSCEVRMSRAGLLFKTWHLRDCAWYDNAEGKVDTMFRRFRLKVVDLCAKEKQGWVVPDKIKEKLKDSPGYLVNCMHVEMPVDAYYLYEKPKFREATFMSVYLCMETNDILHEEPRQNFRYAVARWFRLANSPYAISPAVSVSNPDARTLQSMTYSIMQAGELAVEPPTIAQAEVVVGPVRLFPGGTTWVDKRYDERAGEAIRPVNLGKVPELGVSLHGGLVQALGDTWYLNKLYLPSPDAGMTAFETDKRWQEFLRVSQPLVEPAEPEVNGSVLDVAMEVSMQMGWYGDLNEMPEELEGRAVDFTFDNPIEDARKQGLLMAFSQSMEITGIAAQADPTIPANMDVKTAYRETMGAIAPADWIRDEEDDAVKEDEERLAQQAQQQQMMAEVGEGSEIAKNVGQSGLMDAPA